MPLISAGLTDIGMKRKTNQDSICLYPQRAAFALADGMGGHSGGDIASGICKAEFPSIIDDSIEKKNLNHVEYAIKQINEKIYAHASKNPELKGMGTTVTCVIINEGELTIGNVGDSRAYLYKNNSIYQLSKDHSLVQEKLNIGIYNREQANKDPQKNVLTRTVGFEPKVEVDTFKYTIAKNDLFLLCSDGLHGKVSDEDIRFIIENNLKESEVITQEVLDMTNQNLIDQANANGGQDNISVILVYCQ